MFKSCCVCVGKKVVENHQDSLEADESISKEKLVNESVKSNKCETNDSTLLQNVETSNGNVNSSTVIDKSTKENYITKESVASNITSMSGNVNSNGQSNEKQTNKMEENGLNKETNEQCEVEQVKCPDTKSPIAPREGKHKKLTHIRENVATHNDIQEAAGEESDDEDSDLSFMDQKNTGEINDILLYQGTPRRASSGGILKRPSIGWPADEKKVAVKAEVSDDDEVFCSPPTSTLLALRKQSLPAGLGGGAVGRDELAMRRHRVFSELVGAARAAAEHRVRFDPLGPAVATGSEQPSAQVASVDFEKLFARLEKVVTRLERVAGIVPSPPYPPPPPPPEESSSISEESGTASPSSPNFRGGNLAEDLNSRMSVPGFQGIVQGPLAQYFALSQKIGGDVATHAGLVQKAFDAQLQFVTTAASVAQPSGAQLQSLLAPTSVQIQAIQEFREKNRVSPLFNHLSAISESIPALGWVAVSPTPAPYVKEMNDAGQFYTNRVLKDWKEKDKTHVEWCKAWVQTLQELQAFVKQFHTTGLVWGGKGGVPPPPPMGMPPPPPCPPPAADFGDAAGSDDRSALFAEINKGEDITKSLKKVTSDMQTHKNAGLREGPAPFKAPTSGPKPYSKALPAPGAGQIDKPPVFSRDGKKWIIEYQKGNSGLLVENAEMNNVIYMFKCKDSSLTVKGKVNSIFLDSCTKCAVVFDSLVSSVEFVNCQSIQMQVLNKVPTISIDKTDGCQMYLSPESLDVEIVSSKSSEMNVLIPKGNGDYVELPVAEQFKTTVNKASKSLVTVAVESTG